MSRRLRFGEDELKTQAADDKPKKPKCKIEPEGVDDVPSADTAENPTATADVGDSSDFSAHEDTTSNATEKPSDGKLQFTKQEQKIGKLEEKSKKLGKKLDKARSKMPTKKVRKKERVFNESTGKSKTKLRFEEQPIPIHEAKWNKPKKKSVPRKTAGAVKTAGVNKLHSKVYEVEHENVGTQAAHRGELLAESALRGGKRLTHSAYRFIRNRPYRVASKLEVQSLKTDMKLSYEKALRDNPKLASNPVSRFFQKRCIKKEYAAALRNAKKSGKTAKKAVGAVGKTGQVVTELVRKNPVLMVKAGILLIIVLFIMALFSMCTAMFSGGNALIGATSYAADDADIDNAELYYTEWETDLQLEIANAETTHSGYDEYRYNVGEIGHDPYELMAYLTAVYEDFSYSEVQAVLQQIFDEQYQLTFTPEVEIRYYTDSDGNEVAYEWHILNVTLISKPFTAIIMPRMNTDQSKHFEILMMSKGNRQYVANPFDFNWLPYVTSYYGYRTNPISGEKEYHKGIDIGLPTGTEIKAGFNGKVITVGSDPGGYGNYVVTQNDKGVQAKYAHCNSVLVSRGQEIKKGDIIATVGNTGNSTGPHLHMEVVKDGQYLNPAYFAVTGDYGQGRIPPDSPGGAVIPPYSGEPLGDDTFAALLAEAQRHIGKPYVFGANGPNSFDCSSFVCYSFTQSGVYNLPRTTAQGIYNQCTPVSEANAKPGDLVFFHSTYSTPNAVTHIGIYLGNGVMLHAGSPIGYANINTSYWQQHLYGFGRLN